MTAFQPLPGFSGLVEVKLGDRVVETFPVRRADSPGFARTLADHLAARLRSVIEPRMTTEVRVVDAQARDVDFRWGRAEITIPSRGGGDQMLSRSVQDVARRIQLSAITIEPTAGGLAFDLLGEAHKVAEVLRVILPRAADEAIADLIQIDEPGPDNHF